MQLGYDVFNALDLMENQSFLKELKFGMGDGNLNYYLYNFKCPYIPENKVRCYEILFFLSFSQNLYNLGTLASCFEFVTCTAIV